jgi:demethylmenaquinone methyltransferase/2-methoxy-6-polyprenyl-1,4-benzoquinol methylase
MFDRIARRYDLLNRLMSFGLDTRWRRRMVRILDGVCPPESEVLDVATGTADVALDLLAHRPDLRVVGLDPSVNMLEVGREKIRRRALEERIDLVEGDVQALPYEDDRFAGSCVAFGIRNVPDRTRGLREMARVTRPGGRVLVLELTEPAAGVLGLPARLYVHHIVPALGALLSGAREYRYLQRSIAAFPPVGEFCAVMKEAGLVDVRAHPVQFGVACIFEGTPAG